MIVKILIQDQGAKEDLNLKQAYHEKQGKEQ